MLDVAFEELMGGRAEEMAARDVGPRRDEREHVLELVAEAERAAGLVEARARPHARAERLVQQPPVHEDVEGVVGRVHLHRFQDLVPPRLHRRPRGVGGLDAGVSPDEAPRVLAVTALPEQEHGAAVLARFQRQAHLQRSTRVEAGPETTRQADPPQRGRSGQ